MKVKKVKDIQSFKLAMVNAKKLALKSHKGMKKEQKMMELFIARGLSAKEQLKLEKVINQNYKNDELKIDQVKRIEGYLRKIRR